MFGIFFLIFPYIPVLASSQTAKMVWFVTDQQEKENVKNLLLHFEKLHPFQRGQIQILFEQDRFYDHRVQQILQEQHPDLMIFHNGFVARGLMKSGLLQNLQDIWTRKNLDLQYTSSVNTVSLGDRFYALPISYQDPIVLLYRKSAVKKYKIRSLPKTWEDFQKVCKDLVNLEQIPIVMGLSDEQGGWIWLQSLLPGVLSQPELLTLMTTVEKPAERIVEILDILDLCKKSNFFNKDVTDISYQDALYRFVEQKEGVFFLAKRSSLENFSVDSQKEIGDFFLPVWNTVNSSTAFMDVKGLCCFKTGYNKKVVRDFLEFVTKKSVIKKFHQDLFYKMTPQNLNFFSIFAFWNPELKKQYLFKKSKHYFINDLKKELPKNLHDSMRIFVLRNILKKSELVGRTFDEEWSYHVGPHKQ